jgi:hypothetical protein
VDEEHGYAVLWAAVEQMRRQPRGSTVVEATPASRSSRVMRAHLGGVERLPPNPPVRFARRHGRSERAVWRAGRLFACTVVRSRALSYGVCGALTGIRACLRRNGMG